jgi:excinuclease ABC subunit B
MIKVSKVEALDMIENLREEMLKEAENLNFEKAAELRDKMIELKKKVNQR